MRSTSADPTLAVLVRSTDRATLGRALDSIAANDRRDALVIVVLAACGERHRPLPSDWHGVPLRLIVPPAPLRRAAAANAAIDAARSIPGVEWLSFLDDDDVVLPNHYATLLSSIRGRGDERVVYARTRQVSSMGETVLGAAHSLLPYFDTPTFHIAAAAFHRSLDARFDESLDLLEDIDFWIQCARQTDFVASDEVTNVWFADAGDSGAGVGDNRKEAELNAAQDHIAAKWRTLDHASRAQARASALEAQQLLKGGDDAAALAILDAALRERPRDVNLLNLAGLACHHLGDAATARARFERALRLYPNAAPVRANLGLVLQQLQ